MIIKKNQLFILLLAFFLKNIKAQNWLEPCLNPEGRSGVCIPIRQCPHLVHILLTQSGSESAMQFLRDSRCSFDGNNPIVCCVSNNLSNNGPINNGPMPENNGFNNNGFNGPNNNGFNNGGNNNGFNNDGIDKFNNGPGLNNGPGFNNNGFNNNAGNNNGFNNGFNNRPDNNFNNGAGNSGFNNGAGNTGFNNGAGNTGFNNGAGNTGFNNGAGNIGGLSQNNNDFNKNKAVNNLLPADCGRDLSLRIVGGEKTQLDEFPWMALLEYTKPTGKTLSCGGTLISRRYVMTAAHCIKGKDLPKTWRLSSIRLGEYDTQTNPDCISDGYNSQVCAPPIVTIDIEETIVHENYSPTNKHQINDIALIRLSRDVQFTDYIKPICLPSSENIASNLWVAGWGKTENRSESNIKLKISLPLSSRRDCERVYGAHGINLRGSQICAGSEKGKDTCRGDSGGALMDIERTANNIARWSAVGIVSFGPHPCGMPQFSGVYTRVWDFTDWIRNNMRP